MKGKVALVTGGAQDIGKAIVRGLMEKGASVALIDIAVEKGEEYKNVLDKEFGSDKSLFIKCDVSKEDQLKDAFQKTVERFGKLHVVINNAGINNEKNWEKTIDVNLTGMIRGTYLGLKYMRTQNGGEGGLIVNMSSLAGIMPAAHQPVYTASKFGIIGFTRAIAAASDVGQYGVRINTICPGFVNTQLLQTIDNEENMGEYFQYRDNIKAMMDRYGILEPTSVVKGVIELFENENLNGAVMKITVSAGIHYEEYGPQYQPKM
ncbi:15-hydroxyprostaglandin dehydrogenase [NAD(+)] [Microcaecilia unicolor]|uniref:15-hydroxyprostaglandin dehydrogenase [NAD(+)] n=1 Tax=Microcaecilia unicolor TaxID=1415580 RepID=A0A6P7X210_9AMPH|nr:15-hydroxyprostaglandin dehydrogenase [NAD(+)] [Microcaecilia unicolor]